MSGQASSLESSVYKAIVACGLVGYVVYWTTGYPPHRLTLPLLAIGVWLMFRGAPFQFGFTLARIGSPLALCWALVRWFQGLPAIIALTDFTSAIMVMQWLILVSPRMARQSLTLSGMLVLASAAMNVNFFLPLAMMPFLILLGWSFSKLSIVDGRVGVLTRISRPARFSRLFLFGMAMMFLFLQIFLFYISPRREMVEMGSIADQRRLLGFSDRLQLGEFGTILDNPQVVMRVKPVFHSGIDRSVIETLSTLTLRGCSFISYQNGAWSRQGYSRRMTNLRRAHGELTLEDSPPDDNRSEVFLEVFLENTDPPLLFVPEGTRSIQCGLRYVSVESDGTLSMLRRNSGVETYRAFVQLGRLTWPQTMSPFPAIPKELAEFQDPGEVSPQVRELAEHIASGSQSMGQTVEAVQFYLQRNRKYGYEDVPPGVRDPIAFFLFQSRRGTCEHFASAMVILLRCLKIPSRPVNGYTMGEWNEYGGYFNIQQRHAHSWVEVYFPGSGWLTFDPTGTDRDPGMSLLERISGLREWWNRFEGFWFTYVYSFDGNSQRELFFMAWLRFWRWARKYPIGIVCLVMALWFAANRIWNRFGRDWQTADSLRPTLRRTWIPDWYREWSSRDPMPRHDWETPAEYHQRLLQSGRVGEHHRVTLREIETGLSAAVFGEQVPALENARQALLRLLDPQAEKR